MTANTDNAATNAELLAKLDLIQGQMAFLVKQQEAQRELFEELTPILREIVEVSTRKLAEMERRGYFDFAREGSRILDIVVSSYSQDDVRQLGDNVVRILDTIKRITQPDILAIAEDATNAIREADEANGKSPKGIIGMIRDTRDHDVRRGVAMMMEVMRYVGRGTARMAARDQGTALQRPKEAKRSALHSMLAPKLGEARRLPQPAASSERAVSAASKAEAPSAPTPVTGELACVFIPDAEWNRDYAANMAQQLGVAEFTDTHWQLIEYARKTFSETKSSPNIRQMTRATGIDTKTVYGLFPKSPGIATALCAGIPKPGGCI